VFITLHDQSDLERIQRSADQELSTIPTVVSYASGVHLDTGRATVLGDYDLAIYLGFESIEDLGDYVDHVQHIAFVTKWKAHFESLRVYDMIDLTQ
jgi:Stress responsive A/B Barrel Domain